MASSRYERFETHPLTVRLKEEVDMYEHRLDVAKKGLADWRREWTDYEAELAAKASNDQR